MWLMATLAWQRLPELTAISLEANCIAAFMLRIRESTRLLAVSNGFPQVTITYLAARSLWDPLEFISCPSSCLTSVAIVEVSTIPAASCVKREETLPVGWFRRARRPMGPPALWIQDLCFSFGRSLMNLPFPPLFYKLQTLFIKVIKFKNVMGLQIFSMYE